jgi:hypothetical protein
LLNVGTSRECGLWRDPASGLEKGDMGSDLEAIREQLSELERRLDEVQWRLSRLEAKSAVTRADTTPRGPPARRVETGIPADEEGSGPGFASGNVALVGRTLVVLGGAFVFRAVSDRELIAPVAGALAALLYAAFWLLQCDRSASRGQRDSAIVHGIVGLGIAHPLIWETTLRFELLGAAEAAGLLALVSVLGIGVAARRDLPMVGWVATISHVGSCLALMVATHAFLPLTLALLAGAAAVEASSHRNRLAALRWPAALGVDLAAVLLVGASLHHASAEATEQAASGAEITTLLGIPLLYLTHAALRTLKHTRSLSAFEVIQTATALLLGIGGAVKLQLAEALSTTPLGVTLLLLGIGLYGATFSRVEGRPDREPTFSTWTAFAGLLVLAGCALALPWGGIALAVVWSGLAALAVGLGVAQRFDRVTLFSHAVAYAAAAATTSGLLAASADGMLAAPDAWRPIQPAAVGVALLIAGALTALLWTRPRGASGLAYVPTAFLVALLLSAVAGLAVRGLARLGPGETDAASAAALLATTRTAVIALAAVALAWTAHRRSLPELRWVVPPLLAVGAVKLLWEDLRIGDPLTLFAGLALYGGALIAIPRLLRSGRAEAPRGAIRAERAVQNPRTGPPAAERPERRDPA